MNVSPWETTSCWATQEFPNILWSSKIRWALHWSLTRCRWTQTNSLRSNLILSSHLRLCLLICLLPSGFPTNILYAFPFSSCVLHGLTHFILRDLIILIIFGEEYKLSSSSLYNYLKPLIISSLIGWNILLSTLFSNAFRMFLPQRQRSNFISIKNHRQKYSLCILIFMFSDSRRENRRILTELWQ
jgi:hypothetical protein